jgi:hypothetical protein
MSVVLAVLKAMAAIPTLKEMLDMAIASYISSQDEKRRRLIHESSIDLANASTPQAKRDALLKRFNAGKS